MLIVPGLRFKLHNLRATDQMQDRSRQLLHTPLRLNKPRRSSGSFSEKQHAGTILLSENTLLYFCLAPILGKACFFVFQVLKLLCKNFLK